MRGEKSRGLRGLRWEEGLRGLRWEEGYKKKHSSLHSEKEVVQEESSQGSYEGVI